MPLIDTKQALGTDVANLDFTGLDGDAAGVYLILYHLKHAGGSNIVLQINDDSGNAAGRRHTVNFSTAVNAVLMASEGSTDDISEGAIVLNAARTLGGVSKVRRMRNTSIWYDDSGGLVYSRLYVGQWANSADNIVKLSLVSGTNIAEGSWARLYSYPIS